MSADANEEDEEESLLDNSNHSASRARNRSGPFQSEIELGNQVQSTPSSLTHRTRANRLDFNQLEEEDIEEEEIDVNFNDYGRLLDDDLLSFVNVYFSSEFMSHASHHVQHATNPEINRHGSRIVWVENAQTGEMVPIARRDVKVSSSGRRKGAAGSRFGARRRKGQGGDGAGDRDDDGDDDRDGAGDDLEMGGAQQSSSLIAGIPAPPPPLDPAGATAAMGGGGGGGGGGVLQAQKAALAKQEEEIAPIVAYHDLVMVQRGVYLVLQGMLAGFCFTTLFTVLATNGDDERLLEFYQPNAQDFRRFFYILASVSLIGSIDLCFTVLDAQQRGAGAGGGVGGGGGTGAGAGSGAGGGPAGGGGAGAGGGGVVAGAIQTQAGSQSYQRALVAMRLNYDASSVLLALAIALLYGVAFITVLLMSVFDVRAAVRNGLEATDNWPTLALEDSDFSAALDRWKALNNLRVICSVSAWLGSCLFVWKDLTQLNAKSADLFRLREVLGAWTTRVREMEGGAGIEKLRPPALRRLIALLKMGGDRAKDALSFYEQDMEQQEAAAAHIRQQQEQQQQLQQ